MYLPNPAEEIKPDMPLKDARDRVERKMVAAKIDRQHGNIVKSAEVLGVRRPTIYDLMKKHNLTPLAASEKSQE